MTSLRRPSAAVGRPESQAIDPRRPSNAPSNRDARKSRVGDKIKKRMSMRYAGGSEDYTPTIAPPVPGLPVQPGSLYPFGGYQNVLEVDMPGPSTRMPTLDEDEDPYGGVRESVNYDQMTRGRQDERIGRRRDEESADEWDFEELGKDGVDVGAFVKKMLMGADADEKQRFEAALQRYKQGTAKELQINVFKNYAEFVNMSKEIATLENDMLELKELLGQWKDLPQLMGMEDSLAPTLDKDGKVQRRRTQRNSIADLQQMYKAQLSNLWSTVEGSQKYLPLVPGRHLVFETHQFVELNPATYKAKQSVSLFLLNDLLLIAGRRRSKTGEGARGRMVAEKCWVLADLVVVDVKDSGDLTNALKIRRGKESSVYRTAKMEDKKALLSAFRQVSQELSEKKRKESEKEQQKRKSMWQETPASPSLLGSRPSSMIMTMADSKDMRWIEDFGDELTMAIATRDWEEAVQQVEKGNGLLEVAAPNEVAKEMLSSRLDHLTSRLSSQMLHQLASLEIRKSGAVRLIGLLARIGSAEEAKDTFLKARHQVMMKHIRDIRSEGDISIYINELAIVCFTVIRHTGDWFMTAFHEQALASAFVTWAKEQIGTFVDLFRRQVYIPTVDAKTADECLKVTATTNRKLLRDVGLDFTFLLAALGDETRPHPSFTAPTPAPHTMISLEELEQSFNAAFSPDDEYEEPPLTGTTAPLSLNPRSPRRRMASDTNSARATPTLETPPRSTRRKESRSVETDESLR
ncbi:hypothetical protein BD324DRAFT_618768 [Kockovaella imperatae]|uniref:Exocyst complex component EXO84 n=1 Tax=Kockovaella imperatae TaxID=4999 RepID=A0A1Y1UMA8_9TREE|nr:hypothetical protein BD324DRAFT_618768 [Kockovaella imperatae]ORX39188.1 hypothetical protein BD324DRAFT_618768 [Kockovaella imperatae]